MATYAIGDIQGCHDSLQRLIDKLRFNPAHDQLWLVGDLVNRGLKSLQTLRFIKDLGDAATVVLGNHDLHLLALAAGSQHLHGEDTLGAVLAAPDAPELIDWLRHQPLVHHDAAIGFTMLHAGMAPEWTIADALALSREVQAQLAAPDWHHFVQAIYGNEPASWDANLTGILRQRAIINFLTRARFCTRNGRLDFAYKGPPGTQPPWLTPWFELAQRRSANNRIVFGHWSALGAGVSNNAFSIDTGCVWGQRLTALRLNDVCQQISIDCVASDRPDRCITKTH